MVASAFHGQAMWSISSNDVLQAKGRLQSRRANIESRYAEETKALDVEFAAIEALERIAEEFALRHGREEAGAAREPPAPIDPPDAAGEIGSNRDEAAVAVALPVGIERLDGGASAIGLDILKPGSRWRMYRGNRPSDDEAMPGAASPKE